MKALQYKRPSQLSLVELPVPEPGPDEVLIKVSHAGICGTDIHIMAEESPAAPEVVLGHEFSGTLAAMGNSVNHLREGQRVAVDPNNYCRRCDYCRIGKVHFCRNLNPVGVFRDGAWAEYCLAPANQVYELPKDVTFQWGALCEPFSCILHGWEKIQPVSAQDTVLILGGGIIGILWGMLLKRYNFQNLTFSEPAENRRRILNNLSFRTAAPKDVASSNEEFNLIIDCSGNPKAVQDAFAWLKPLGKFLLFGVCPATSQIQINPFQMFKKELTLIGSVINPFAFSGAIELIKQIQLPIENLGVQFYHLTEYHKAIEEVKSGRVTKGIFVMD